MTIKHFLVATSLVALSATPAMAGETVEIRNFVGTINWTNGPLGADITENRGETEISTQNGLTIDGGIDEIDNQGCRNSYASWSWDWGKKKSQGTRGGYEDLEDYPVIDLTFPEDTELVIRNAVIFTLGEPEIGSANLNLISCGKINLGDIGGELKLKSNGSADLTFHNAASLDLDMRGSGDVSGGDIVGEVILSSRGSGDIELGDIGRLTADLRGSGDLEVETVKGAFAGGSRESGDIEVGEIRGDMVFVARGSGDLETGDVYAENVEIETTGSSSLHIDGGEIETLSVTTSGSSDIMIDAVVNSADLRALGSGDIYVKRVTGAAESKSSGSGDIEIGRRD